MITVLLDFDRNEEKMDLKKILEKLVNRETITYIIAGVLTTAINFIAYHWLCNILQIENLIANAIAWVVAVAFAYVVNAKWVFLEPFTGWKEEIQKISKFTGARVVTFVVEEIGMFIFVDWLHGPNLLMKAIVAVLVIILNYIFSKLFIFNRIK